MVELKKQLEALVRSITEDYAKLDIPAKAQELAKIRQEAAEPSFWERSGAAALMQKDSQLASQIEPWQALLARAKNLDELIQLNDSSLEQDIETELRGLQKDYQASKKLTRFSGPYDNHDVILSIYAGAGGTDAQDWAQMLQRMYTRWCENHGGKIEVLDLSAGDEAGIKSVTLKLSGIDHLYGKLRGEHGVHRMVRKSPFNAAGSRETSFARVDVLPEINQPSELVLDENDLKIDVFRSGGAGGQSVNTTDSAVRVTHMPTGVVVTIQNERSQLQNKETALTILRSRLAQLQLEQHAETLAQLKGPSQSAEFGSQIRNYVLDDRIAKDLRSGWQSHDPGKVLDGDLDPIIDSLLEQT